MDIFEENCDTENNCTVSYFWKGLALFLLGVIIGLFVSPIKKGVTIGCNNKIDKGGCNDHFDPEIMMIITLMMMKMILTMMA